MNATNISEINGPCAWTGLALAQDPRWRFALSGLSDKLAEMAEELENGSGLANLSGLPIEAFGDGLRHVWYGIGLHMGRPIFQDFNGQLMRDIQDERQDTDAVLGHELTARDGSTFTSSKARTLSNGQLRFHTDRCDVVALLCVRQAAKGGVSRIASSVAIHNAMLQRYPDLAALLYRPIHRSRLGEERGGEALSYPLPVFGQRDGRFTSHYSRTYVEAAQEMPGIPRMTDEQWRALDVLAELADELCMDMTMQSGDMQFINNHVIYHARTPYEDHPDTDRDQRRMLHRLWLTMPNSRPLPEDHAVLWRNVEAGAPRGGIGQD